MRVAHPRVISLPLTESLWTLRRISMLERFWKEGEYKNLLGNNQFILKIPNSSTRMDLKLGNEMIIGWHSKDCRALDLT